MQLQAHRNSHVRPAERSEAYSLGFRSRFERCATLNQEGAQVRGVGRTVLSKRNLRDQSGSERCRKFRKLCGQPAVLGETVRFRPVPPQAEHFVRMNATPSDLPFGSTGFAMYPLPPQVGQSSGATPSPPHVESILHDIALKFAAENIALRIPNTPLPYRWWRLVRESLTQGRIRIGETPACPTPSQNDKVR